MKNAEKTNIFFTFMIVFYLLSAFVIRLIPYSILNYNARLVLPEFLLLIPAILYVSIMQPAGLSDIRFDFDTPGNTGRIIVATFAMMPFINLINSISTIFVENQISSVVSVMTDNPLWLSMVIMALVPAVVEEYIFRGLIFNGYRQRNPLGAMLMSAFFFALLHLNVNQFIYAFVMGVLFCLLDYATGTLMSSIIAHFIFNAYNVILVYAQGRLLESIDEETVIAAENELAAQLSTADYIIGILISLAIVAGGVLLAKHEFRKICESNRGYENVKMIFKRENRRKYREEEGRFFDVFSIMGILVCVVYIIFYGL